MKLTTILLLAAVLQVSATGNAQKTITYSHKSVSLEKLFSVIKKQTSYVFFYREEDIKNTTTVSVNFKNTPLEVVLEQVLTGQKLKYNIQGKAIFITKEIGSVEKKEEEENLPPPPIDVKGRVVNEKGEPVIATVTVKGTKKATSTNENGEFVLTGVEDDATLVITGVGIETFEVRVNGRADLATVTGKIKVAVQEEVIINAGYYKVEDRKRTGNIARVTSKEIEKQPVTSPLMALQGRMAGVDITPLSGVPGGSVKIQIRGQNSLRTQNQVGTEIDGNLPLYVIDGVPIDSRPLLSSAGLRSLAGVTGFDPLSTLDIGNIESIEVLKDADATAIYGSRGANGVVLISTKKRIVTGETNLDISVYRGRGKVSHFIDLLNTRQYLEMRREAFVNDNALPGSSFSDPDLLLWDTTHETNWQKVLFGGTSEITDLQAGISWGNNVTSFRLGGSYHGETLVFPGEFGFQRGTGHFNLNHTSSNKKFRAIFSINYGSDNSKLFENSSLMTSALTLPPNAPKIFVRENELNWENSTWSNPFAEFRKTAQTKTDNLISNINLSYEIIPGLFLKTSLGYNDLNGAEINKYPISANDPSFSSFIKASNSFAVNKRKSSIIEPQISYNIEKGNNRIYALIGTTIQKSVAQFQVTSGNEYTSDAFLDNLKAAPVSRIEIDDNTEYKYAAIFGRIGYDWKDKYLVNLSGRRDGSSRFGPNNRYGNFGAIGAGWIFSEESFFQELKFLSLGKLRFSYGTTGNDQIGDYKYYNTYSLNFYPYQGQPNLSPTALYNPEYAWEVTKKLEAALQIGVINNRILLELSWYRNRSSNQLVQYSLPAITGFSSVLSNLPATVENKGLEIVLQTDNFKSQTFRWATSFNFTLPRNKLVEFPDIEFSPYSFQYQVGQPLSIIKLYPFSGVNVTNGFYEYVDVNGDGNITEEDRQKIQYLGRNFYGGLNNTINFRKFELSFHFQYSKQSSTDPGLNGFAPGFFGNQHVSVLERWKKIGDATNVQLFSQDLSGPVQNSYYQLSSSDASIVNASFVRLKTLSFSWTLPDKVLEKIRIKQGTFFLQGQNLFTVTNYKGLDPETGNALPPLRIISGGVHIKF